MDTGSKPPIIPAPILDQDDLNILQEIVILQKSTFPSNRIDLSELQKKKDHFGVLFWNVNHLNGGTDDISLASVLTRSGNFDVVAFIEVNGNVVNKALEYIKKFINNGDREFKLVETQSNEILLMINIKKFGDNFEMDKAFFGDFWNHHPAIGHLIWRDSNKKLPFAAVHMKSGEGKIDISKDKIEHAIKYRIKPQKHEGKIKMNHGEELIHIFVEMYNHHKAGLIGGDFNYGLNITSNIEMKKKLIEADAEAKFYKLDEDFKKDNDQLKKKDKDKDSTIKDQIEQLEIAHKKNVDVLKKQKAREVNFTEKQNIVTTQTLLRVLNYERKKDNLYQKEVMNWTPLVVRGTMTDRSSDEIHDNIYYWQPCTLDLKAKLKMSTAHIVNNSVDTNTLQYKVICSGVLNSVTEDRFNMKVLNNLSVTIEDLAYMATLQLSRVSDHWPVYAFFQVIP